MAPGARVIVRMRHVASCRLVGVAGLARSAGPAGPGGGEEEHEDTG